MATNCLGPFLLNHHLQGVLSRTSKSNGFGPGTVRIVWLTSFIESTANGGIMLDVNGAPKVLPDAMENYLASKVGNVFLAHECAKRLGNEGIISVVRKSAYTERALILCVHSADRKTECQPRPNEDGAATTYESPCSRSDGMYALYLTGPFQESSFSFSLHICSRH